jgi:hypothetical protein
MSILYTPRATMESKVKVFVDFMLEKLKPSGPGWLHEIKFDGYRVIARKDGEQVRLWARTTSDYSKAFTRIRDAVAALPVDSVVIDGEAVILRPDNSFDFQALRSRQGQAEAILVAYDVRCLAENDSPFKAANSGFDLTRTLSISPRSTQFAFFSKIPVGKETRGTTNAGNFASYFQWRFCFAGWRH